MSSFNKWPRPRVDVLWLHEWLSDEPVAGIVQYGLRRRTALRRSDVQTDSNSARRSGGDNRDPIIAPAWVQ